jgi:hypothetical protein
MKYNIFVKLCDILKPYIEHQDTNYRDAVSVQKAIAMVLHKLAYGLKNCIVRSNVLADKDKLYPQYISIPSGRRLKEVIRGFHHITKLPQICGAIDGSHIKLYRKPPQKYTLANYWYRHDAHTVLLQGICDSNGNFLDVCVVAPGSTYDATHMRSSAFF